LKIFTELKAAWLNSREMPALLRVFIRGGMVSTPILFVFVMLPLAPWTINGKPHTYSEMWRSGAAPLIAFWLALLAIGCWGVAARKPLCRWILVLSPVASEVVSINFQPLRLVDIASAGWWAIVVYVGLFHFPSVRTYLGGGYSKSVSAGKNAS
jgi:hypothetical protein